MCIRYRSDRNKWQSDLVVRGSRVRHLFETKKEAEEFERKFRTGKFILQDQRDSVSIADAFGTYYQTESSFKCHNSKINDQRYLNFAFHFLTVVRGLKFIDEIQLEDLQAFQQWIREPQKAGGELKKEWSLPTVARCCKVLKHLFRRMAMARRLKEDPGLYWMIPTGESQRRRPMTTQEFERLLDASADWFKPILRFMRFTGARGSSIANLTWADIDLHKRLVVIKSRKGGRQKVRMTTLPIMDELFAMLASMRNERRWAGPADFVFLTSDGKPILQTWISAYGNRLIKKVGLEGLVLYSIRHALATDMTEAGLSLELVRQAMGHSSVRTTQHYAQGASPLSLTKAFESVRSSACMAPNGTKSEDVIALGGEEF